MNLPAYMRRQVPRSGDPHGRELSWGFPCRQLLISAQGVATTSVLNAYCGKQLVISSCLHFRFADWTWPALQSHGVPIIDRVRYGSLTWSDTRMSVIQVKLSHSRCLTVSFYSLLHDLFCIVLDLDSLKLFLHWFWRRQVCTGIFWFHASILVFSNFGRVLNCLNLTSPLSRVVKFWHIVFVCYLDFRLLFLEGHIHLCVGDGISTAIVVLWLVYWRLVRG